MERFYFALIVFASLAVAGCIGSQAARLEFFDCGDDLACFKSQAEASCGPANASSAYEGISLYAEVTPGTSNESCSVFLQLVDVTLPAAADAEARRMVEEARPFFSMANMRCQLAKQDASRIDDAAFLSSGVFINNCEGLLKEQLVRLREIMPTPTPTPAPRACNLPNALGIARGGECIVVSCLPGAYNANGEDADGCESDTPAQEATPAPEATLEPEPTVELETTPAVTPEPEVTPEVEATTEPTATPAATAMPTPAATPVACVLPNAYSSYNAAGECGFGGCRAGYGNCDSNTANGCEVKLNALPNCGACGKSCPDGVCSDGVCRQACSYIPNARSDNRGGNCVISSCNAGYADCDGLYSNGCELSVYSNPRNCGACGVACSGSQVCQNGACITSSCRPVANAEVTEQAGVCVIARCLTNYVDCNHQYTDGCEADLVNSPTSCGSCATACRAGEICSTGVCR